MLARYRSFAVPLAVVAAVVLFYLVNPWFFPAAGSTERGIASVAFWVLMIVVLVLLFSDRTRPEAQTVDVEGPAFARYLFSNTRAGLIWLPIRLFLGFEWGDCRLREDHRDRLDRRWVGAAGLLEQGRGDPHDGPRGDHLRVVPALQFLIDNGAQTWFGWLIAFATSRRRHRAHPGQPPSSTASPPSA